MTSSSFMPRILQAVGLACVPVADMPKGSVLARKPVAAAVITLKQRDDGHCDMISACVSDARDLEYPLPVLLNDLLIADAPKLITQRDVILLQIECSARRFFVEDKIAALAAGNGLVDPAVMFAGAEESALCRRLSIPPNLVSDRDVELAWRRDAPEAAEGVALTIAASRMMLWAHAAAFAAAVPNPYFELLLPLRAELMELEEFYPALGAITRSRPMNRAASFSGVYSAYRAARDAGDNEAKWVTFEDNLLHT